MLARQRPTLEAGGGERGHPIDQTEARARAMSIFSLQGASLIPAVLAVAMVAAAPPAAAQHKDMPDFAPDPATAWVPVGDAAAGFSPIAGHVAPLADDPAHPYVANGNREGRQPTDRIADLANPNLKPWVEEAMKKDIDEVLAHKKLAFTPRSSCVPPGVPSFMAYGGGGNMTYFLQAPGRVWILFAGGQETRHVYLDVPHTANPKPSWYGESVGHYEGDTLVVDTIGQTTETFVDPLRTPHSEKLHVVERWRLADDRTLELTVMVEDPEVYYQPWWGLRRYRRVAEPFYEHICAENNQQLVDWHIPVASKPDF
jgi:hypothetical protein